MTKVGRPLKYNKPEELEQAIDAYFKKTPIDMWTVTGLALVVGSKHLLSDYSKREGYGYIIDRSKLMIENAYEISLKKNGRSGDIFALKNFGWKDRTEQKIEVGELDELLDDLDGKSKGVK